MGIGKQKQLWVYGIHGHIYEEPGRAFPHGCWKLLVAWPVDSNGFIQVAAFFLMHTMDGALQLCECWIMLVYNPH